MRRTLALAALSLIGCASVYHPPTGDLGGYSKVTIRNAADESLYIRLFADPVTCSGWVTFDLPLRRYSADEPKTYYARKGELTGIAANFSHVESTWLLGCWFNRAFVPTGDAYEVVFNTDPHYRHCEMSVYEGDASTGTRLPKEKLVVRKKGMQVMGLGPLCEPLTTEQFELLGLSPPPKEP